MNCNFNYKPTQLLFIDATVNDIETLLQGTLPGIEAHILSGERDGVAEITQILQHRPEINTVHIVSHGSPGCVYLGDSQLSLDTLNLYTSQLHSWSREGLNLLLYGCNVAVGDAGEEFVSKLHSLTGANIAASVTLTGNANLGGNWNLEFTKGDVSPTLAFTADTVKTFNYVLGQTLFSETFANNNAGWTLGPEWQIGSAKASSGGVGNPDPAFDNTPTADNGIAGVVIGGNASTVLHGYYYITSPVINTNVTGNLNFDYYRWLNSDYTPYMQNTVEVFNGSSWVTVWTTGGTSVFDNAWTKQSFDITSYKSSATQVRFGFQIGSGGVYTVGSWNIDDVKFYSYNLPALNTPTAISYTDTANDDTFSIQTGTLSATDLDGDPLTYGITGGTVNGTTTISKTGTYGSLTLNSSTGAYTYTPNDGAIEALTSNATEGFSITVTDGTATDNRTLTINLTGVNDTPTLNTPTAISYTDTVNDDTFNIQTGTLAASDRDSGQTLTYGITGGTVNGTTISKTGTYGSLTLNSSTGAYTYTPNDGAIEALTSNATEGFTFTVSDGTATDNRTLTINLTGVNDTPTLNTPTAISYTDTVNDDTFNIQTGTLAASDRDSGQTLTYGITGGTVNGTTISKTGTYGSLTLNSSTGAYTYTPNDGAIEALTSNATEGFTFTVSDGTATDSKTLTINLTGVNDTPTLNTLTAISYTDTVNDDTFNIQTGTLAASDQEGQTLTYGIDGGTVNGTTISKTGTYGILTLDSITGAYTFTPNDGAIEALTSNATAGFTFTVSDGTATDSKTLAINLTGANDTPIITPSPFSIQENSANGTVLGTVTGSDVESSPLSNWTITAGNTDIDGDGNFAFAMNAATGQITVNDSGDLDFETQKKFDLQVTVSDGSATSNPANVTVNLLDVIEFTPSKNIGGGTSGNDSIATAQNGNYLIYGYGGNDTISCGTGSDIVYGGDGNDTVYGGDGDDRLYGDSGNDSLYGGAGADTLYGGVGDDLLNGGLGNDKYYGEGGIDTFVIGSGQGNDSIYGYEKGIDKILVLGNINIVEKKSGSNLLLTSVTEAGTEILATVYNVAPGQISYLQNLAL